MDSNPMAEVAPDLKHMGTTGPDENLGHMSGV